MENPPFRRWRQLETRGCKGPLCVAQVTRAFGSSGHFVFHCVGVKGQCVTVHSIHQWVRGVCDSILIVEWLEYGELLGCVQQLSQCNHP